MEWFIGLIFVGWLINLIQGGSSSTQTKARTSDPDQKKRQIPESKDNLRFTREFQEIEDQLDTPQKRARFNANKAKFFPEPSNSSSGQGKNISPAVVPSDLSQQRRQIAQAKAALWLTQQQQNIEDQLDTPEKRARFNTLKAEFFPKSSNSYSWQNIESTPVKDHLTSSLHEKTIDEPLRPPHGTIKNSLTDLKIEKLYHFTRASNLRSISEHGLLSVSDLRNKNVSHFNNDHHRHDKRLNGISTSVSFPNSRMFFRYRMENPSVRWAILEISSAVLHELDCLFCRYNAADKRISGVADKDLRGARALQSMFEKEGDFDRPPYLRTCDPTDEQAEVLVMEKIDLRHITGVILEDRKSYELEASALDGSLPLRFSDADAMLFNARKYARRGYQQHPRRNPACQPDTHKYDGEIPF